MNILPADVYVIILVFMGWAGLIMLAYAGEQTGSRKKEKGAIYFTNEELECVYHALVSMPIKAPDSMMWKVQRELQRRRDLERRMKE